MISSSSALLFLISVLIFSLFLLVVVSISSYHSRAYLRAFSIVKFCTLISYVESNTISLIWNFRSHNLQIFPRPGSPPVFCADPSLTVEPLILLEQMRNFRVFFMHFLQFETPQKLQCELVRSLTFYQAVPHVLHPYPVFWYSWEFLGLVIVNMGSFSSKRNSRLPMKNWRLASRITPLRDELEDRPDYSSIFFSALCSLKSAVTDRLKASVKSLSLLTNFAKFWIFYYCFLLLPRIPRKILVKKGKMNGLTLSCRKIVLYDW